MNFSGRTFYWIIAAFVVVTDQVTKLFVDRLLPLHRDYRLIDGFLSLQYVRNEGAAFGILSNVGLPYKGVWLSIVSMVALGAIVVYALKLSPTHKLPQLALALVMGGAVGNLLDRSRLGYVIDFVLVYWREHRWPNFNVADSAITIGICLLVLDIVRSPETKPHSDLGGAAAPRTE